MDVNAFIGMAITEMMRKGVRIEIRECKKFRPHHCSYFSTSNWHKKPEFFIIYEKGESNSIFTTFVHEYCHFLQWKMKTPVFIESTPSLSKLQKWLNRDRKKLSMKHIRLIQRMELDCDRKALAVIHKYELPVDIDAYIQEANSYILSYNYIHELRDFGVTANAMTPEACRMMPDKHLLKMRQIEKGIQSHYDWCILNRSSPIDSQIDFSGDVGQGTCGDREVTLASFPLTGGFGP